MPAFKQWVYHATEKPKVIDSNEFEDAEADGWADSPAKFIQLADFNVDPNDANIVQQFGEAVEGVKEAANGALNISTMNKNKLEAYARKHFNVELDKRLSIKALRKTVSELVGV